MNLKATILSLLVALFCAEAAAQKPSHDLADAKASAEESCEAFMKGDIDTLIDFTYPKIVQMAGGRAKMIAFAREGLTQMKSEGFEPVSYAVGEPREVLRNRLKLYVILPTVLKAKVRGGVMTVHSYLLGVSAVSLRAWTFIDGAGLDASKLRTYLPEAAGRIKLPAREEPTFEPSL